MKATFIVILIITLSLPLKAQNSITLSGTVIDEEGEVIQFATISLFEIGNRTPIKGTLTNERGNFSIPKLESKGYLIKVSFIGYKDKRVKIDLKEETSSITIIIERASTKIDEVVVTGQKPVVEYKTDRLVFNVTKDISAASFSTEDLLRNVPELDVDIDGNVSMRGSSSILILIDGRQIAGDNQSIVDEIPPDAIERVEVITNPSAKYAAEGSAGVINIILKKEGRAGLDINVRLGATLPFRGSRNSIGIKYQYNKLNFSLNYDLGARDYENTMLLNRETYEDADTTYFKKTTNDNRMGMRHSLRYGVDYYIDAKNLLSFRISNRISDDNNNTDNIFNFQDNSFQTTEYYTNHNIRNNDRFSNNYSLYYKTTFAHPKHQLVFDLSYNDSKRYNENQFTEYLYENDKQTTIDSSKNRNINDDYEYYLTPQIDYTLPLGETATIETGLRIRMGNADENFTTEEYDFINGIYPEKVEQPFTFKDELYSGYFILSNTIGKFSSQIGIRLENYHFTIADNVERSYTDPFPSVNLTYKLANNSQFRLGYSKRINRPSSKRLNPNVDNLNDTTNITVGNPDLNPEYTHVLEFGYVGKTPIGFLTPTFYFRNTSDVIESITSVENDVASTTYDNLSTRKIVGITVNLRSQAFHWWTFNLNGDAHYADIKIDERANTSNTSAGAMNYKVFISSNMKIWNEIGFYSLLAYRGPRITAQGVSEGRYFFMLNLQRDFFKKRLNVSAGVIDPFGWMNYNSETVGSNFVQTTERSIDFTTFRFGIRWKFHKGKDISDRNKGRDRQQTDDSFDEMF